MTAPAPSPDLYDSFGLYGSTVTLVSVRDWDADRFFVAASVLTASVDPFTLAISVGQDRDAVEAITTGAPFAVGVLATDHLDLVRTLTSRAPKADRLLALDGAGAMISDEGPLWLPDALVTFWCTRVAVTPVADQLIVVGRVDRGSDPNEGSPLLRWNREFRTATSPLGSQQKEVA